MTITPLKLKKNNMFLENFRLSIKSNKKILIVISILHLLGLPLLSTVLTVMAVYDGDSDYNEVSLAFFIVISVFCLFAVIICGIIIAVNTFSYLHKKSQVDMVYALPVKRKTKFLSDFFAGLFVYIVPYIAACILSVIIILSSGVCVEEIGELIQGGGLVQLVIQGETAGLLIMISLYTLSVLVLTCCGTLFESIMNILIMNALIPGVIAVIAAMFFADLYGVPVFETVMPVLGYTSPAGACIYLVYLLGTNSFVYSDVVGCLEAGVYGKWIVFFMLFTAAVFALSMLLYMKRKAEDVSKPYVYRLLYYFVITSIVMAIALIARYDITTIVPVIVFSLIVYMIFEVITNRGFKKIYKSLIRYAVTMVAVLAVCIIAEGTKGFGVENRIPSMNSVKSVELSYQGFDRSVVLEYGYVTDYFINGKKYERNYDQKEIIETVLELHEDILEKYQSGDYDEYNNYYHDYYGDYYDSEVDDDINIMNDVMNYDMAFVYHLKNGSTLKREYTLTYEQISKLYILDSTPQMSEFFKELLMSDLKETYYSNNKRKERYTIYISNMLNYSASEKAITKSQARELSEAYAEDYRNMTTHQMLKDNVYCYINYDYPVRESFKNTIACMEKYNLTVPEITRDDFEGREVILYSDSAVKCWGYDNVTASFGPYCNDYSMFTGGSWRELNAMAAADIFSKGMARAPYYEARNCYVITVDGERYVIPYEYSDKAYNWMWG